MPRYQEVQKLKNKLFFTVSDVAGLLAIKPESAWVLCSRYVKNGIFIRLKNNFYILAQNWETLGQEDFFKLANYLQVPSYISFMTALTFYGISTQVQRGFFESASLRRSAQWEAGEATFNFCKLKKRLYFDFNKQGDYFIATREKAFVDAAYLYSFGKYTFDIDSLDLKKLDKKRLKVIAQPFPDKTKKMVRRLCAI